MTSVVFNALIILDVINWYRFKSIYYIYIISLLLLSWNIIIRIFYVIENFITKIYIYIYLQILENYDRLPGKALTSIPSAANVLSPPFNNLYPLLLLSSLPPPFSYSALFTYYISTYVDACILRVPRAYVCVHTRTYLHVYIYRNIHGSWRKFLSCKL